MPLPAKSPEEIVENLLKLAVPNNGCADCHLASFADRPNRARHFIMVGGREGKRWRASRLVWHVVFGPIPDGLFVLHECDNQLCINPHHLFLGTAHDNTQDMMQKGRHKYENKPRSAIWRKKYYD